MKLLKNLLICVAILAVIILAHAIPELVVALVPAWILVPLSFAFILFLVWAGLKAFEQVIKLSKEGK